VPGIGYGQVEEFEATEDRVGAVVGPSLAAPVRGPVYLTSHVRELLGQRQELPLGVRQSRVKDTHRAAIDRSSAMLILVSTSFMGRL
jgi:hypothetical protein